MPHSTSAMLAAALRYRLRDLPISPLHYIDEHGKCSCGNEHCNSPGKHPLSPNGVYDATTDEAQIRAWWTLNPHANIGLPVGPSHHRIAFDIESARGHGVDGFAHWEKLQKTHGFVSQTFSWHTGSDGLNGVLEIPPTVTYAKTVDIVPGVSIRASEGQYVVLPPSTHVLGVYTIVDDLSPAMAPQWIVDLITGNDNCSVGSTSRKRNNGSGFSAVVLEGQRHNVTTSLAGYLLSQGVTLEEAVEKCLNHNRTRCEAARTDEEVIADVVDIYSRYASGTPLSIEGARKYIIKNGTFVWVHTKERYGRVDRIETPLCNFTAHIDKEVVKDDGAEQTHHYVLKGKTAKGKDLPSIEVPADKFDSMQWASQWGIEAVVEAGYGIKDHLRAAIKYHSLQAERHSIYTHLGWREINNHGVFLHAGGALGERGNVEGIEVAVSDSRLRSYKLPDPSSVSSDEINEAIAETIDTLDAELVPDKILYPLLAMVFRSPLCECLDADFSVFLTGPTGSVKTSLTAVIQSFFGAGFSATNLPGNWNGTANALERLSFLAKDVPFPIDDFAPRGTPREISQLNDKADRVLRGQANKGGRDRMRVDGTIRPTFYPRGIIIATGEDVPTGVSLRGRLLHLELTHGTVDLNALTRAQDCAARGVYALALAGYIQWLAPQMEYLKERLEQEQNKKREWFASQMRRAKITGVHPRAATTLASLSIAYETWLRCALERRALPEDECAQLQAICDAALLDAARMQVDYVQTEDPVEQALGLLRAAFTMGQAHLNNADDDGILGAEHSPTLWGHSSHQVSYDQDGKRYSEYARPQGSKIGWLKGDDVLFEASSAYTAMQRVAQIRGTSMPLTQQALWKRLEERGIATRERTKIAGKQRRVISIRADLIWGTEEDETQ